MSSAITGAGEEASNTSGSRRISENRAKTGSAGACRRGEWCCLHVRQNCFGSRYQAARSTKNLACGKTVHAGPPAPPCCHTQANSIFLRHRLSPLGVNTIRFTCLAISVRTVTGSELSSPRKSRSRCSANLRMPFSRVRRELRVDSKSRSAEFRQLQRKSVWALNLRTDFVRSRASLSQYRSRIESYVAEIPLSHSIDRVSPFYQRPVDCTRLMSAVR